MTGEQLSLEGKTDVLETRGDVREVFDIALSDNSSELYALLQMVGSKKRVVECVNINDLKCKKVLKTDHVSKGERMCALASNASKLALITSTQDQSDYIESIYFFDNDTPSGSIALEEYKINYNPGIEKPAVFCEDDTLLIGSDGQSRCLLIDVNQNKPIREINLTSSVYSSVYSWMPLDTRPHLGYITVADFVDSSTSFHPVDLNEAKSGDTIESTHTIETAAVYCSAGTNMLFGVSGDDHPTLLEVEFEKKSETNNLQTEKQPSSSNSMYPG